MGLLRSMTYLPSQELSLCPQYPAQRWSQAGAESSPSGLGFGAPELPSTPGCICCPTSLGRSRTRSLNPPRAQRRDRHRGVACPRQCPGARCPQTPSNMSGSISISAAVTLNGGAKPEWEQSHCHLPATAPTLVTLGVSLGPQSGWWRS